MAEAASTHDEDEVEIPREDPWEQQDPWTRAQTEERAPTPPLTTAPPRPARHRATDSLAGVTASGVQPGATEVPPARVIHDVPPSWSGENPEKELDAYLKLLQGWIARQGQGLGRNVVWRCLSISGYAKMA